MTKENEALTPRHKPQPVRCATGEARLAGQLARRPKSFEYVTECCPDCGGIGKVEAPASEGEV